MSEEPKEPWCGLCGHEIRRIESPEADGPEWEHIPFSPASYDHWAAPPSDTR